MAAIVEKLAAVVAMTLGSSLVRISVRLSPKGMRAAWHLLMVEAKTGKRKKARPQLAHCEPMPENTSHKGRGAAGTLDT